MRPEDALGRQQVSLLKKSIARFICTASPTRYYQQPSEHNTVNIVQSQNGFSTHFHATRVGLLVRWRVMQLAIVDTSIVLGVKVTHTFVSATYIVGRPCCLPRVEPGVNPRPGF